MQKTTNHQHIQPYHKKDLYKKIALICHPDKCKDAWASEMFRTVHDAYTNGDIETLEKMNAHWEKYKTFDNYSEISSIPFVSSVPFARPYRPEENYHTFCVSRDQHLNKQKELERESMNIFGSKDPFQSLTGANFEKMRNQKQMNQESVEIARRILREQGKVKSDLAALSKARKAFLQGTSDSK